MLLDEATELFVRMEKADIPDGEGGQTSEYTPNGSFWAAAVYNSGSQARAAQQTAAVGRYLITTKRGVVLKYHEIIKRARDGLTFKIVSGGTDRQTPHSAWLDMRQWEAEEWKEER